MKPVVIHLNALLFENPDDRHYLLAADLEDPAITWMWPNKQEPDGWSARQRAAERPQELNAKRLPAEHGMYSGWPGCRTKTAEEKAVGKAQARATKAAKRTADRAAQGLAARPAHRPPLAYDQKVAHVTLRATNGDVLRWGRAAAIEGLVLEDWLLRMLRGAGATEHGGS